MKILFISSENPFPLDHGHHIRTFQNLLTLSEQHEIYFIGFDQTGEGMQHIDALHKYCRSVDIYPCSGSDTAQAMLAGKSLFTEAPMFTLKYSHPDAIARIAELTNETEMDLLHLDILHISHLRKYVPDLPTVLVNHNVEWLRMNRWAQVSSNPMLRQYLKNQINKIRPYEYRVCGEVDCCIAVSETDRAVLQQHVAGGKIICVPNGVDAEYFQPGNLEIVPNSMVWTGAMSSPYNADGVNFFVEEIWPLIVEQLPDALATFIGKSPTRSLQALAEKNERVACPGFVEDIRPVVDQAAVFIAPLRSGSGTKIKVLNAMAQGKAVVTTSIGAEGIEAQPDRDILIADTSRDFAAKVLYLMAAPDIAGEMGRNARRLIERTYAWKVIAKNTLDVYTQVQAKWQRRRDRFSEVHNKR